MAENPSRDHRSACRNGGGGGAGQVDRKLSVYGVGLRAPGTSRFRPPTPMRCSSHSGDFTFLAQKSGGNRFMVIGSIGGGYVIRFDIVLEDMGALRANVLPGCSKNEEEEGRKRERNNERK